jgi:hypothetical protein
VIHLVKVIASVFAAVVLYSVVAAAAQAQTADRADVAAGTGSLSGRITFTDGKPAARKVVQYQPLGAKNAGNTAVTDLDGNYAFKSLADGLYLVGFFHPDRVPPQDLKNRGVIPDPNASAETIAAIGAAPVVKQVEIKGGQAVTGIDFSITDIGPETVEGPEVSNAQLEPGALPPTGLKEDGGGGHLPWAWLVALAAVVVVSATVVRAASGRR